MKIEQLNHDRNSTTEVVENGDPVHQIKLIGETVQVTIIEREGRLTISVDPLGQRFIARLDTDDVSVNDIQARLVIWGRELTLGEMAAEGHFPEGLPHA